MGVTKKAIYRKSASKYVVRRVILVYRPHSLEGRDLSFWMPVQRRDSSKELSWFGRLNQVLETTTMRWMGTTSSSGSRRNWFRICHQSLSSSSTTLLITTSKLTSAPLKLPGRQTYRPGWQDNRYILAQHCWRQSFSRFASSISPSQAFFWTTS